ncbi:MAG: hypothetical protein LLG01_10135 [Planctomycetaceae bacterium]|nr:hypothetical protein [Planctomycetaceae bacterium]
MSEQSGNEQVPAGSPAALDPPSVNPPSLNPAAFWALGAGLAAFVVGYVVDKFILGEAAIIRESGQLLPVSPAHQYVVAASVSLSVIAVMLALPSFSRRRANRTYGLLGMAVAILMLAWNILRIIEWRMKG